MIQSLTAAERRRALPDAPPSPLRDAPTPPEGPSTPRRRLPFIDGLRGVAMLMVLAFHCWQCSAPMLPEPTGRWCLGPILLLRHGYLGVHLFLLLSGFCLTYPLARDGAAGMRLEWRRFFRRRAWRILPPYYVALALFSLRPGLEAALRAALGRPDSHVESYTAAQVVSHVLMVHNFSPAWVRAINGSFWSLALEWQLYLVFPLLVWSFRRCGPARTVAAVLALTLAYRSWVYATHAGTGSRPFTSEHVLGCFFAYTVLPGRVFEFVLGMVAALALARRTKVPSQAWIYRSLSGFVLFSLLGLSIADGWSPFSPVTDVVWGLAFFCLVMYAGGRAELGGGWLDSRPLVALGTISYSVYLIHEPLIRRAAEAVHPLHLPPAVTVLLFGLGVAPLAIGGGWLYFRVVETRFIRSGARAA